MFSRILQRLTAIISTVVVLAVASSHVFCATHAAHGDDWQSVTPAHEHVICECELCPCSVREATLAVQWKSIDDLSFQPVVIAADWQYEALFPNSPRFLRSFVPPDDAPSSHLRFQKVTVILI